VRLAGDTLIAESMTHLDGAMRLLPLQEERC
jgi:hypothetical protein